MIADGGTIETEPNKARHIDLFMCPQTAGPFAMIISVVESCFFSYSPYPRAARIVTFILRFGAMALFLVN